MASVDETKVVREFLEAQPSVVALTGTRLWPDLMMPPSGYKPSDGVGMCFKVRGGVDLDPSVIMDPSIQFKIYGHVNGKADETTCREAARVLHDNFNERANKYILTVRRETMPVVLQEPDTKWTYVLVFYKVMVRNLV